MLGAGRFQVSEFPQALEVAGTPAVAESIQDRQADMDRRTGSEAPVSCQHSVDSTQSRDTPRMGRADCPDQVVNKRA